MSREKDMMHVVNENGDVFLNVERGLVRALATAAGHPNAQNVKRAVDPEDPDYNWADGWQGLYHLKFMFRVDPTSLSRIAGRNPVPVTGVAKQFFRRVVSMWPAEERLDEETLRKLLAGSATQGKGNSKRKTQQIKGWKVEGPFPGLEAAQYIKQLDLPLGLHEHMAPTPPVPQVCACSLR
jgi:hypothetical protein